MWRARGWHALDEMRASDPPLNMSLTTREAEADLKKRAKSPSKAGVVEQTSSTGAPAAPLAKDRVSDSAEDSSGDAPASAMRKKSAAPAQDPLREAESPQADATESALTASETVAQLKEAAQPKEAAKPEEGAAESVQDGATGGKADKDANGESVEQAEAHAGELQSITPQEDEAVDPDAPVGESASESADTPADITTDKTAEKSAEKSAEVPETEADPSAAAELAAEEPVRAESDEPEPAAGPDGEAAQADGEVARTHNTVKIRGRPGGVAIEIGQGDWSEMLAILRSRLEIAEGFFRGGRVVLDVGDQTLDEDALELAFDILSEFEMHIAVVRGTVESTLDAAARMGITSTTVATEDPARGVAESHVDEELHHEVGSAFYVHHGNLRSGQVLERTESVIVIGDVNPGAQVVSHGDVLVYGRLRGSVHAGAQGDEHAMVTAIDFEPTQLRIAGFTSVPPEDKKPAGGVGLLFWRKDADAQPGAEYAYAADGRIFVEPWNPTRSGSLAARRRRV